ncbi:MAG: sporulation protein YunB [Bacilli bacterium]|nr:sporulation protein YunB [Bacilli bacterium]
MKKIKFIIIFMLLILIPLSCIKAIDNYFSERTNEFLEQAVTLAASDIFSSASLEVAALSSEENFLKYKYDSSNNITGVYVDTIVVNKILALVSNLISDSLNNGQIEERLGMVEIPLGQLCSQALFANVGPNIKIETSPMSSYTTDLFTETSEFGINNTLLEVYIKATISIEAFIPLKSQNITLETKIYLISEVLQGSIPIYYFSGNLFKE